VKRLVFIAILIASFVIGYRPLLRSVYNFLIREDPAENVDFVALVNGGRVAIDRAIERVTDGKAQEILIVERRPPRVVQIGAARSLGDRVKKSLILRGMPESSVHIVTTGAVTNWQLVRELDQYLISHSPAARVAILFPEHQTRYLRWIVDREIDRRRADQFEVWSFSTGVFDAENWWSNRLALFKVAVSYLRLIHAVGFGEGDFDANNWSPESYQRSLETLPGAKAA